MANEQDDNEVLIEAVRSFPCIWNMSLREYKDNRVKENAWSKVSQKLGTSIDDSKRRWKNLRDKFVREHDQEANWDVWSTFSFSVEILQYHVFYARHSSSSKVWTCTVMNF